MMKKQLISLKKDELWQLKMIWQVLVPLLSYLFHCLICMCFTVFLEFLSCKMSHREQLVLPVTLY